MCPRLCDLPSLLRCYKNIACRIQTRSQPSSHICHSEYSLKHVFKCAQLGKAGCFGRCFCQCPALHDRLVNRCYTKRCRHGRTSHYIEDYSIHGTQKACGSVCSIAAAGGCSSEVTRPPRYFAWHSSADCYFHSEVSR